MKMFTKFVKNIKQTGKQVVVVAPVPVFKAKDPGRWARFLARKGKNAEQVNNRDYVIHESDFQNSSWYSEVVSWLREMEKEKLITVLYPHSRLFENQVASMYRHGRLYYRDHSHLSVFASEMVVESFRPELKNFLFSLM